MPSCCYHLQFHFDQLPVARCSAISPHAAQNLFSSTKAAVTVRPVFPDPAARILPVIGLRCQASAIFKELGAVQS